MSGMSGGEVQAVVSVFSQREETCPAMFAALVPKSAAQTVQEVIKQTPQKTSIFISMRV
mgnify:CR=1 FL=1